MATASPLFPQQPQPDEPLESPEVLVINALLHSERFDPHAYGIDVDMLAGYQQAWSFCQEYQDKAGAPPPVELFHRSFPSVEIIKGVDPHWACDRLKQAHYEREVRRALGNATRAVREGDIESVRDIVRELVQPSPLSKPKGMNITDIDTIADSGVRVGFNVPWAPLNSATHGHGRGQFWLLGARLGQGKSALVPGYVLAAAKQGAKVAIASCEMPMRQYAARVHMWQAPDLVTLRLLRSMDEAERRQGLDNLPALVGSVDIYDPSVMRMNLRGIENLCSEYDMVWIDHIGLLSDHTGKRAIEDWRVMAVISNTLKEYALRFNVALGGAAQINREGETATSAPPKVSNLAQSDALGQDADVVITLKRLGERSMLHQLAKNREGHNVRWYTEFEPAKGSFREIDGDQARQRMMADADQHAND